MDSPLPIDICSLQRIGDPRFDHVHLVFVPMPQEITHKGIDTLFSHSESKPIHQIQQKPYIMGANQLTGYAFPIFKQNL